MKETKYKKELISDVELMELTTYDRGIFGCGVKKDNLLDKLFIELAKKFEKNENKA